MKWISRYFILFGTAVRPPIAGTKSPLPNCAFEMVEGQRIGVAVAEKVIAWNQQDRAMAGK